MFYISKVSPFLFLLALLDLFVSLAYKSANTRMELVWIIAVFGFVAHTIMSAMYQLIPNSQNRPLKLPFISYFVFVLSLLISFLFYMGWTYYASFIYAFVSLIFVLHTLSSVRNWQPITVKFLGLSNFYFFLSSLFLPLSQVGYVPFQLAIHTLTLGFMLNAVMGTQLAWIPMLYMEPLNIKYAKYLFYISSMTIPLFLLSFYALNYKLIALVSFFPTAFVGYFLWIIYSVFSGRRMPKEIPLVIRYFILAMIFLPFGMMVGTFMASENIISFLVKVHVDLILYGFTAITIMGGMAHLYPRILYGWIQKKGDISIQDIVDEMLLKKLFPFVPASVYWMVFCDALGFPFSYLSAIPYAIVWLLFFKAVFLKLPLKGKVTS
jgi:hypothetical protein